MQAILSCLIPELFDGGICFLLRAAGDIHFRPVLKNDLPIPVSVSTTRFKGRVLRTRTVSLPIPVFPPVTTTTFPLRSGTSASVNFEAGGYAWSRNIPSIPIIPSLGMAAVLDERVPPGDSTRRLENDVYQKMMVGGNL